MKGISAFVATILLVGFTVAVGAVISTWFLTYTRTTTTGVGAATACAAGVLDVTVPSIQTNSITVSIINRGTVNVTNALVSVTCGATPQTYIIPNLAPATTNTTILSMSCPSDYSNIIVSVSGTCVGGGTITGGCSGVACRLV